MGPGREAATVRQIVLVVVLVGAAFLGGAFVNGPGLRWVQTQLLGSMGLGEEADPAAVDLKLAAGGDGPGANPAVGGPLAPAPSLVEDAGAVKPGSSEPRPVRGGGPESKGDPRPAAESPRPSRRSSRPASSQTVASSSRGTMDDPRDGESPPPLPADLPAAVSPRAPRDPDVTLATASSAASSSAPADRPAPSGRETSPTLMDSLSTLMPSPAPAPPDSLRPPTPAPAPPPAVKPGDDDWGTLARKMQSLGVSRFTIEGQPGGRVVFSCLIPVAGRQAVAQRFEAEGEDAVQAARAAMRRVALWRAAQPSQQPR
jgi:hypothetical protein